MFGPDKGMCSPAPVLKKMRDIVREFSFFLLDFNESGKITMYRRIEIWILMEKFRLLTCLIRRLSLSENDRYKYIQICGEFRSANECMNIICSQNLIQT